MKKKLLTIIFAVLVFSIPLLSVVNGQALSDVLKDLRSELKMVYAQRTEEQAQFQKNYDREHKRMVDIITASNELSILLYTQEQDMTFDLIAATVEHDCRIPLSPRIMNHIVYKHLASAVEPIMLVIGHVKRHVLIAAARAQHVESVDDKLALPVFHTVSSNHSVPN